MLSSFLMCFYLHASRIDWKKYCFYWHIHVVFIITVRLQYYEIHWRISVHGKTPKSRHTPGVLSLPTICCALLVPTLCFHLLAVEQPHQGPSLCTSGEWQNTAVRKTPSLTSHTHSRCDLFSLIVKRRTNVARRGCMPRSLTRCDWNDWTFLPRRINQVK